MGRPEVISRDAILESARRIFLEKGFGASTAAIARAAGVSEGSIFKRFPTKADLFREAIMVPELPLAEELEALLSEGPFAEGLERVGLRLIELFREMLPRLMMAWAHQGEADPTRPFGLMCPSDGGEPMPLRLLKTLAAQFEQQQRAGRMRAVDPEILARMLIGSCHNFAFFEIIGAHRRQPLAASSFVRGVVDALLDGVAPPQTREIHE